MKKLICLITLLTLVFSLCSCSVINKILPGKSPDTNQGADNTPSGDGNDDIGEAPDKKPDVPPDPPIDPDGGKEDPVDPDGGEDDNHCEGGCCDTDGDAICDNCGNGVPVPPEESVPTIFLAGDSTVKTYQDGQYIAGWGQYLSLFLEGEVKVVNAAHGGRSSRSFINEGRLYDIPGSSFTFSENGGNSIADQIKAGDYLFIQFGHNDDDTKMSSNYQTIYDRMVPLGTPDANGIYPTTPAVKTSTSVLPSEYTNKATDAEEASALATIQKYGSEYYAYGSGTYKWYLKQYIDFARSVGATPVLVTPVARVKFSGGEIIGGAGLHGDNFAYVEAVRQLAEEEDCLLIDLFADTKVMLETATPTYANYLMALKPNELTGTWPLGYDAAYGNVDAGYTGIEATHYNKFGAYLQAAKIAEHILMNPDGFSFAEYVLATPTSYVHPSNLISKSVVTNGLASLFTLVSPIDPEIPYASADAVVERINGLLTYGEVTSENYIAIGEECAAIRLDYAALNVDYRADVTNLSVLEEYENKVKEMEIANRPAPSKVVIFNADDLSQTTYDSTVTEGEFTLVATADKKMDKKSSKVNFTYNGENYSVSNGLSMGGKATFGSNRYISFTVDGPCTVTIAVRSSGTDTRTLTMVNEAGKTVGSYEAPSAVAVSSIDITEAGTYSVGSAGSGMYVYMIIIEYFG